MLLPALNAAREKARATDCTSKLKQIGLACQSYVNDYGEYIISPKEWIKTLSASYLPTPSAYQCRDSISEVEGRGAKDFSNPGRFGYGIRYYCPVSGCGVYFDQVKNFYKITFVRRPSKSLLVCDSFGDRTSSPQGKNADNVCCSSNTRDVAGRHNNWANILFFDGHVHSMPYMKARGLYTADGQKLGVWAGTIWDSHH